LWYEQRVKDLKKFEKFTDARVEVGADPPQNRHRVKAARINAEIELLKSRNSTDRQAAQQSAPEKIDSELLRDIDPFILDAIKPNPNDSPLRKLQKDRCREQAYYLGKINQLIVIGRWHPQDFLGSLKVSASLSKNLLELMEKPTDQLKCLELRLELLKSNEKFIETRVNVGTEPAQNLNFARAARIDAEIDILKFKTELDKPNSITGLPQVPCRRPLLKVVFSIFPPHAISPRRAGNPGCLRWR
jgi:hypothetical protein